MEVRIEGNATLVEAVEKGQIDIALVVGHDDRPTAERLGELERTGSPARSSRRAPGSRCRSSLGCSAPSEGSDSEAR